MTTTRRARALAIAGALSVVTALAIVVPVTAASAAECTAPAWDSSTAYLGGAQVSFNGHQYTANWWTQGHRPDQYSGQWQEWRDDGACSGGGGTTTPPPQTTPPQTTPPPTTPPPGDGTCDYPAWTEGQTYQVGTRVSYAGGAYEALVTHTAYVGTNWNPASTPTLWRYLSPCGTTTNPPGTTPPGTTPPNTTPPPTTQPPTGDLPRHFLTGYWHNFANAAVELRLSAVPDEYDLIAVAFAEATATPGQLSFTLDSGLSSALGGYTDAQFRADINTLHSRGKHVILSVGGEAGRVQVNSSAAATTFADSAYALMQSYGFDGVDIDLENGLNPTYMAQALRALRSHAGTGLIITMAPQTIDMQSTGASYFQLALAIKDILTVVHTQYYNSGSMLGCDQTQAYGQGTVNFMTALACIQLENGLRPDQVALGLPAGPGAAGGGVVSPSLVNQALDCLAWGTNCGSFHPPRTYPGIRGAMTWSINWDQSNGGNFARTVRPHLDTLP